VGTAAVAAIVLAVLPYVIPSGGGPGPLTFPDDLMYLAIGVAVFVPFFAAGPIVSVFVVHRNLFVAALALQVPVVLIATRLVEVTRDAQAGFGFLYAPFFGGLISAAFVVLDQLAARLGRWPALIGLIGGGLLGVALVIVLMAIGPERTVYAQGSAIEKGSAEALLVDAERRVDEAGEKYTIGAGCWFDTWSNSSFVLCGPLTATFAIDPYTGAEVSPPPLFTEYPVGPDPVAGGPALLLDLSRVVTRAEATSQLFRPDGTTYDDEG